MKSDELQNLALVIGWIKVNDDVYYSNFEHTKPVSKNESVSTLLKIYHEFSVEDCLSTLSVVKNVLPRKLLKNINKATKKFKTEDIKDMLETTTFMVEEAKTKCEFYKLKEYGLLFGKDIEKLGYSFSFELPKKIKKEILNLIEYSLPMEYATKLARIKNLDFKIGFCKDKKNLVYDVE